MNDEITALKAENSRLATIANDQCDKTLLKASLAAAWEEGRRANIGPRTPSWIQKCWLASTTFATCRREGK